MAGTSARERLGAQLRRYRRNAALTGEELAARLGISQGTISKVETGKLKADADLVRQWLTATGADGNEELLTELVALADSGTSVSDWATLHAGGWEAHQLRYDELERSATQMRFFQNAVVPGLLQTAGYTSFLMTNVVGLPQDKVGSAVTARLARQEILWKPTTRVRAVLTEAVVRHRLAGASVMVEQLGRLADLARLPTVELGVIPVDTDMPTRYGPSFDLYENLDGGGSSVALIELEAGEVREVESARVARYSYRHDLYWAAAVTGDAAISFIDEVADSTRRRIFG